MKPPVPMHPDDDRLLELAYGEVPAAEARALRQHVDGCARCRTMLHGIAEVRTVFRSMPAEPAPEHGLESLLAYGEQAAARARSRRGGLRILALLSAAAAFAVVWVVMPARAPATKTPEVLAQAEAPRAAAQGDRLGDEPERAKDAKEPEKGVTPVVLPLAKAEREDRPGPARRVSQDQILRKEKGVAKLEAPAEERQAGEAARGKQSDAEVASRSAPAGNLSGALAVSGNAGGKAGAAGPSAAAGAGAVSSTSGAGVAKKRAVGGRDELDATARQAPASPPASVAAAAPVPAQLKADDGRTDQMARIAAAPVAEGLANADKAPAPADAAAPTSSEAKTMAKPSPKMQSARLGSGSPEKEARLAEVKRQLDTAKGDARKPLLMERCEIEASLQRGPDAVLSCSNVVHEFPGTPEASRAGEIARGFSVQPPAADER